MWSPATKFAAKGAERRPLSVTGKWSPATPKRHTGTPCENRRRESSHQQFRRTTFAATIYFLTPNKIVAARCTPAPQHGDARSCVPHLTASNRRCFKQPRLYSCTLPPRPMSSSLAHYASRVLSVDQESSSFSPIVGLSKAADMRIFDAMMFAWRGCPQLRSAIDENDMQLPQRLRSMCRLSPPSPAPVTRAAVHRHRRAAALHDARRGRPPRPDLR